MTENPYPVYPKRPGSFDLLGIPLHPVDVGELHGFISAVIDNGASAVILNLNIHCVNLALRLPWLAGFLREVPLVFCDGDGVRWGAKLLGMKVPPKITYDRWTWQLAEYAYFCGYSLYLLGSGPGVAEKAARSLHKKYPDLRILGTHHGYFEKEGPESEKIISEINDLKPDIILVGFGMPLQEKWLLENHRRIHAHIFLAGGAALECVSGLLKRPPAWVIRLQMEWLFRFAENPRRGLVRYVWGIPYFFYRILREKAQRMFSGKKEFL